MELFTLCAIIRSMIKQLFCFVFWLFQTYLQSKLQIKVFAMTLNAYKYTVWTADINLKWFHYIKQFYYWLYNIELYVVYYYDFTVLVNPSVFVVQGVVMFVCIGHILMSCDVIMTSHCPCKPLCPHNSAFCLLGHMSL